MSGGTSGSSGAAAAAPSVLLGPSNGATSASSATSPFAPDRCRPRPQRCTRGRSPIRTSKTVVRPGRRNGGTTLVFTLREGTVVRFTVVRVYPSCERVGSFSVRAHRGVNRVRFKGRLGRRPLPAGTYRLVAQARGREAAAATVTIVVARGNTTPRELRRARGANSCSAAEAHAIETVIGAAPARPANKGGDGGVRVRSVADPIVGATKAAVKKAKRLTERVSAAVEENVFADPFVLLLVGLFTLAFALLGTLVLLQVVRIMGLRDPRLR
jgi:hypothetical protein